MLNHFVINDIPAIQELIYDRIAGDYDRHGSAGTFVSEKETYIYYEYKFSFLLNKDNNYTHIFYCIISIGGIEHIQISAKNYLADEFQKKISNYIQIDLAEFSIDPCIPIYDLCDLAHTHARCNEGYINQALSILYLNHYGHMMWDAFYNPQYEAIQKYIESSHDAQYPDDSSNHF